MQDLKGRSPQTHPVANCLYSRCSPPLLLHSESPRLGNLITQYRSVPLRTGYLPRLTKFAQEKCGNYNTSSSQVQQFPSIREKIKVDCLEDTAPSFTALGRERERSRWFKNRFFE